MTKVSTLISSVLISFSVLQAFKPTHVDLSDNFFTNITVIATLPIEVLNLSRSRVEWIENGSFRNLSQLRVLDLSHNSLTSAKLNPHAFEVQYDVTIYTWGLKVAVVNSFSYTGWNWQQDENENMNPSGMAYYSRPLCYWHLLGNLSRLTNPFSTISNISCTSASNFWAAINNTG